LIIGQNSVELEGKIRALRDLMAKGEAKVVGYVALIVAAEITTVLINPGFGVFSHLVVLTALLIHSSLAASTSARLILLPLALGPLTRILSLAMPLNLLQPISSFPLVYIPLFLAAVVVMRNLGLKRSEVGIVRGKLLFQIPIAVMGIGLGLVEFGILRPPPLAGPLGTGIVLPALILIATTGFVEELVFRGVLQHALLKELGRRGVIYAAIVFAVLHIGYLSVADVVFVFAVSILFAWARQRTGSLIGVSISHGLTNTGLYLVFPSIPF